MGEFDVVDFGSLFDATYALPWEEWIAVDDEFPVSGRAVRSQFSSVPACQKIVKKAIVEKLRDAHRVEQLPETGPKRSVEVALLNDRATLTIDTSGPGLHKRGYRTLVGQAPLKETLAAAMVLLSYWRPERPLVDPFCGSGTIPIEAALIGRNLAPDCTDPLPPRPGRGLPGPVGNRAQEARDRRCRTCRSGSWGRTSRRPLCVWLASMPSRPACRNKSIFSGAIFENSPARGSMVA